jgi:hypothetical protein
VAALDAAMGDERKMFAVVLVAERERYTALVGQVVEFKRLDYGPEPVRPAPMKDPVVPIPADVARAVATVSEPNTRERRQIETRVRDLLVAGYQSDEVARMVEAGEEVEA